MQTLNLFIALVIVILNLIYLFRVKGAWAITKLGYVLSFFTAFLIMSYEAFGLDVSPQLQEAVVTLIFLSVLASSFISLAKSGLLGNKFKERELPHAQGQPTNGVSHGK